MKRPTIRLFTLPGVSLLPTLHHIECMKFPTMHLNLVLFLHYNQFPYHNPIIITISFKYLELVSVNFCMNHSDYTLLNVTGFNKSQLGHKQ